MRSRREFWYRRLLLITLGGVLLFWAIFFGMRLANRQLASSDIYTNLMVTEARGDIQNLPLPSIIEPGRTSQNAAGVITAYKTATQNLRQYSANIGTPLLPRLLLPSKAKSLAHRQEQARQRIDALANSLGTLTNAMSASQKFVEYMPQLDLTNLDDANGDRDQRLQRTRNGLLQTTNALRGINCTSCAKLASTVLPLAADVPELTDATLPAWAKRVLQTQATFVDTFQADWQKQVRNPSNTLFYTVPSA